MNKGIIASIEKEYMKSEIPTFEVGDTVKVIEGALEGFVGVVETLDLDNYKCRVNVSMFGRETPVDLELNQIEAVEE